MKKEYWQSSVRIYRRPFVIEYKREQAVDYDPCYHETEHPHQDSIRKGRLDPGILGTPDYQAVAQPSKEYRFQE